MSEGLNLKLNSTWKTQPIPRGKQIARHNKTALKTTVSLYLSKNLVEKARKQGLNLSRICEEALNSILTYMEAQNTQTNQTESSIFLSRGSFQKETRAGSLARLGHPLDVRKVTGSNPVRPTKTDKSVCFNQIVGVVVWCLRKCLMLRSLLRLVGVLSIVLLSACVMLLSLSFVQRRGFTL